MNELDNALVAREQRVAMMMRLARMENYEATSTFSIRDGEAGAAEAHDVSYVGFDINHSPVSYIPIWISWAMCIGYIKLTWAHK